MSTTSLQRLFKTVFEAMTAETNGKFAKTHLAEGHATYEQRLAQGRRRPRLGGDGAHHL
jgi:hypothetical protein